MAPCRFHIRVIPRLLLAQGDNGIDRGGAPRWQIAGHKSHRHQCGGDGAKQFWFASGLSGGPTQWTITRITDDPDEPGSQWKNHSVALFGSFFGDIRLDLTDTPRSMRPMDALDSPCLSGAAPVGNCYPSFTARLLRPSGQPPDEPLGMIQFTLYPESNWKGSSSNWGRGPSGDDASWDYQIEQSGTLNPDAIFEAAAVILLPSGTAYRTRTKARTNEATLQVSSFDYGGRGTLMVQLVVPEITGTALVATVVNAKGEDANRTYVRIPMDEDNDGLADSWEDANGGMALVPTQDSEPGADASSPTGDGFTAHDEYRGFHFLGPEGAVTWSRTDPRNRQDVFYWDSSTAAQCGPTGVPVPCFTNALNAILKPETQSFVEYRPVDGILARAFNPALPELGTNVLNSNGVPGWTGRGYALVYVNASLGANCGGAPPTGGPVGDAETFQNDGRPVKIDLAQIGACGALKLFPADVYLARTLAHETGHKYGLGHPLRLGCCNHVVLPVDVQTLTLSDYSRDPIDVRKLYVRYQRYDWATATGPSERKDEVARVYDLAGNEVTYVKR